MFIKLSCGSIDRFYRRFHVSRRANADANANANANEWNECERMERERTAVD